MGRSGYVCVALVIWLAACGSTASEIAQPPEVGQTVEVGLGPLGPRNAPVAVAVGTDVLVVGGNQFFCGPTEDCARPEVPPLADGAILDTTTREWRSISPAPTGVDHAEAVAAGAAVYVLTQCDPHPSCPAGRSLLHYDVADDRWSTRSPVPGNGYHHLVFGDERLYAISTSDEAPADDYVYKVESDTWVPLPAAPMPPVFDRFAVSVDGHLVLYGSPTDAESREKHVASFDVDTQQWEELDRAPSVGWQVFDVDDTIVLNPHFGSGEGGFHDVVTDTWTALPDPPDDGSWNGDIAGVIGERTADYEYAYGSMLDLRTQSWISVAESVTRPADATVVAVGNTMVVVGGHHWTDGEVRVDGGVRLWSPPS